MPRERLDALADQAWSHRLTVVAAPAGSGKTTILAGWAAAGRAAGRPIAWYRTESTDAALASLLAYLQLAIGEALMAAGTARAGTPRQPWHQVEDAVAWLERHRIDRLGLIIDDYHRLAGSEAEDGIARLLDLVPPGVAVVLGSRSVPTIDVSRWRLSGDLLEIDGDDLRFRSWEVERLFRDHYGEGLRGDELGRLARRTEGWAAGLQFFHLATSGKAPSERARLLDSLTGSARLVREYLARNVLDELPAELRDFLVSTCLLRRLSGRLCDRFLDTSGSAASLEELERRQVFTVSLDDGTYRYHEVLQAHLERLLVEERGEAAVRELAARAAALLEAEGALAEALVAYCRAESWEDAARVLGRSGDRLDPNGSVTWLADVAPALIRDDPWLRLASARRLRAEGRWRDSVDAFAQAEHGFGTSEVSTRCRTERLALAAFVDPSARPPSHWAGRLRAGLRRDPLGDRPADQEGLVDRARRPASEALVRGLLDLSAGFVRDARATLRGVSADPTVEPATVAAGEIAAGLAGLLAGDAGGRDDLDRGTALAERLGQAWVARLGRGALALGTWSPTDAGLTEIRSFRAGAAHDGDPWGEVLFALLEGWAATLRPIVTKDGGAEDPVAALDRAASEARRLGSGTLEAWALALAAWMAARLGGAGTREAALRAESAARASGVRGALVPVFSALAAVDPSRAAEHRALVEGIRRETGLRMVGSLADRADGTGQPAGRSASAGPETRSGGPGGTGVATEPPVEIHLLGGFAMQVAGRPVDLSAIKPRPRAILRMLALNAGRPVHREVLAETFWPAVDPPTASRNVHVAISGLRRELGAGDGAEPSVLVREGDAYLLVLPEGSWIDLAAVEDALSEARAARGNADHPAGLAALRRALSLASQELLPEDGPAEWVIYRREQLRAELAGAARETAASMLSDDPAVAAEVCATALRLDPHNDGLWRLLIETHDRAGDHAASETARQGYARVLEQLGVEAVTGGPGTDA